VTVSGPLSTARQSLLQEIAASLPKKLRLVLGDTPPADIDRLLVLESEHLFDGNIAILLAAAAAARPNEPGLLLETEDGQTTGLAIVPTAPPDLATLPRIAAPGRLLGADAAPASRPALFLDRDGTLNIDHGYVGTRDRFEWIDGAREAVARATASGWHVFIVTNQSGVARGYYDEPAVEALHDWLADEVRRAGGTIDDVRICPFHPEAVNPRYRQASDWRKPLPGMLLDLIRAWQVDPRHCVMIGDQPSDVAAAQAAGMPGHLFPGGDLDAFVRPLLLSGRA
jgi:D-glycero-D-manno-heptose 1,7-bisphosphate phosphatase